MEQVVDIATDGRHLSRHRGFLLVEEGGAEVGRVPLDRINSVIVHAHGTTWTASLMVELARRGCLAVLCHANHAPAALLWPIEGHHEQGARMRAQWDAPKPLSKRAWTMVIKAKVAMQAAALEAVGKPPAPVAALVRKVRSGDPDNVEAQAARRYWPLLMGKNFRRDTGGNGANALLNYGYTVLRAATARAVLATGLHPTIGIHHRARGNAFALADDLMEPFRPLVDLATRRISIEAGEEVTPEAKLALARILSFDLAIREPNGVVTTTVTGALSRLTVSLAQSFEAGKPSLVLPEIPSPLALAELGR